MAGEQSTPAAVEAVLTDPALVMTPPVPAARAAADRAAARVEWSAAGRCRLVLTTVPCHQEYGRSLVVLAGMADGCLAAARAAGHPVTLTDRRTVDPAFDPVPAPDATGPRAEFLAAVAGRRRGLFAVPPASLAAAVVDIRRTFPAAVMLVVVPTRDMVRDWSQALPRALDEAVGRSYSVHSHHPGRRVIVATPLGLRGHVHRGPRLAVLVDAHRMAGPADHEALVYLNRCAVRLYGLVPPRREADPVADAVLEMVCGPLAFPPAADRAEVRFVKSAGGRVKRTDDLLGRKRAAYWANAPRNRRVAEVARATAAGLGGANPPVVAVVAANTEQLGHLARDLPGWAVRDRRPGRAAAGPLDGNAAVTALWAAGNGIDADVVVFAAGSTDRLPGRLSRPAGDGTMPAVMDLDDGFDAAARRDARLRARHYETRGWRVAPAP